MSFCNDAKLTVEIYFKNNRKLAVNTEFEADRPLDTESFKIENISSGCTLFTEIYKAYGYYYDHDEKWDSFGGGLYNQYEEHANLEVEKIKDFTQVKEIVIKERFCWEWDECWTKTIIINSNNCPHIKHASANTKRKGNMKRNMPIGLTSIGKDAFRGCIHFVMNVHADSSAHQYAKKYGIAHNLVDSPK